MVVKIGDNLCFLLNKKLLAFIQKIWQNFQRCEINDDLELLHSKYQRKNNGTTSHQGHQNDCPLALMNIVKIQMRVL